MDFSFLNQGQTLRHAAPSAPGQAPPASASAAPPAARFNIPSHREVQDAAQPSGAHNVFSASGAPVLPMQQQQQRQPPPPPPQQQQQQQQPQQQHQHQQQHQQHQQQQQYHHHHHHAPPFQGTAPPPSAAFPSTSMPFSSDGPASSARPAAATSSYNPNVILVGKRQQGNPLLKHLRNVRWQFGDVSPDYVLGQSTCALYISLRYHLLHPEYLLHRIKEQLRAWGLVVVLCHIDVEDVTKPLAEISKAAVVNSCTLVCAWSAEECARYLETFKSYESKPASNIQERVDGDYLSRLTSALTSVRGVNKTDALTLANARGTLADILRSSPEQLSACPGIGPTKVQRLMDAFQQPFRKEIGSALRAGAAAPNPGRPDAARGLPPAAAQGAGERVEAAPAAAQRDGEPAQAAAAQVAPSPADDDALVPGAGTAAGRSSGPSPSSESCDDSDPQMVDAIHDELLLQATQMLTQVGERSSDEEDLVN